MVFSTFFRIVFTLLLIHNAYCDGECTAITDVGVCRGFRAWSELNKMVANSVYSSKMSAINLHPSEPLIFNHELDIEMLVKAFYGGESNSSRKSYMLGVNMAAESNQLFD
jgi:hypothetical protein